MVTSSNCASSSQSSSSDDDKRSFNGSPSSSGSKSSDSRKTHKRTYISKDIISFSSESEKDSELMTKQYRYDDTNSIGEVMIGYMNRQQRRHIIEGTNRSLCNFSENRGIFSDVTKLKDRIKRKHEAPKMVSHYSDEDRHKSAVKRQKKKLFQDDNKKVPQYSDEYGEEPSVKRPKLKGLFQDNSSMVRPLTVEKVTKKIRQGKLRTCKPKKNSRNYDLYKVCRKIETRKGQVLADFFICSICGTVMKVNVSTHHNTLKRHYNHCTGNVNRFTITTTTEQFFRFIEAVMELGSEFGVPSDLTNLKIPSVIDKNTRRAFISTIKNALQKTRR